jgi:hypothetical protein
VQSHENDNRETAEQIDRSNGGFGSLTASRVHRQPDRSPNGGQDKEQSNDHEDH